MTLYSSREPFNDDPHPNVWSGHTERNQMRTDTDTFRKGAPSYLNYEGNYIVRPRPEYDRPQNNPTNPILVEFRKLHEETGNDLWTDAYLSWSDLIEEDWGTRDEYWHAFSVLGKIVASKKGDR